MRTVPAVPREDTRAWKVQVWAAFGLATALCGSGLAWLPGEDLDRAFMFMAYLFCTSAAFVVAKHVRDAEAKRPEAPMWSLVVWGGFAVAVSLTAWGLVRMEISPTYKAYLGASWLFLVSSVFTLAKTLRDAQEVLVARSRAAAIAGVEDGIRADVDTDAR
ncbi:MAG: hypothetical protein RJA99_3549 [Pseudomonadota bacterium]|jgi:hypothetical protein